MCDGHHIDFRLPVINGTREAGVHYVKRCTMRKIQNVRGVLLRVASLGLVIGLALTATQAYGYSGGRHGGHYGYGYYGGQHGGQYRHSYSRHRYGYYPYRYGGRYHGGLVHGLLSVPSTVVGSLFGHRHGPGYHGGAYGNRSTTPPATGPGGNGAPSSGGAYGGNAAIPPTTGPDQRGASRDSSLGTMDGGGWARLAEGRHFSDSSIHRTLQSCGNKSGRDTLQAVRTREVCQEQRLSPC